MKASTFLKWVGLVVIVALAYAAYRLGGSVIEPKVEQRIAQVGLTPNQIAANGPLPGDVSLYAKELACQQKIADAGLLPVAQRRRDLRQRAQRHLPLRQLPRLARRAEQCLRLAQRRRLPRHRLHQQPQAGRAVHRRRRGADAWPTRCRPGPTSPRPTPPPASRSGAPTSTTPTPRAG